MGTDRVLPSLNSTRNVSSETVTSETSGIRISTTEILFPRLHNLLAMLLDQPRDTEYLRWSKPATPLQSHRIQPEFRYISAPFHMHMYRLVRIVGVEVEPVRATV